MKNQPYQKYKDSNIDWLEKIPEEWEEKRLRFCVKLNPSKNNVINRPEHVSFLPMESIGDDGSLDLSLTRPWDDVKQGYTFFQNGDVTYAIITPCFENGKGALMHDLTNGMGFGTTELAVLRPNENHDAKWLWYVTVSSPFRDTGKSYMYGAGGQKRVPDDFTRNFLFPRPPYIIQKKIASFLDSETARIDSLVVDYEELIALLQEKRQALISHAVTRGISELVSAKDSEFSEWAKSVKFMDSGVEWLGEIPEEWRLIPLKHICCYLNRGYTPCYVEESDIFVVNQATFSSGTFNNEKTRFHDPNDLGYKKAEIKEGDVLLASTGGGILGKTCQVDQLPGVCFADTHVTILRFNNYSISRLVYYFLSCNYDFINTMLARGSTNQIEIERPSLQGLLFPVAPKDQQEAIVSFLNRETTKIDILIKETKDSIALLKEHRSALITNVVTGKINVEETA